MSKAERFLEEYTATGYECGGMVTFHNAQIYGDLRAEEARAELLEEWRATDVEEWLDGVCDEHGDIHEPRLTRFRCAGCRRDALAMARAQAKGDLLEKWNEELARVKSRGPKKAKNAQSE